MVFFAAKKNTCLIKNKLRSQCTKQLINLSCPVQNLTATKLFTRQKKICAQINKYTMTVVNLKVDVRKTHTACKANSCRLQMLNTFY